MLPALPSSQSSQKMVTGYWMAIFGCEVSIFRYRVANFALPWKEWLPSAMATFRHGYYNGYRSGSVSSHLFSGSVERALNLDLLMYSLLVLVAISF